MFLFLSYVCETVCIRSEPGKKKKLQGVHFHRHIHLQTVEIGKYRQNSWHGTETKCQISETASSITRTMARLEILLYFNSLLFLSELSCSYTASINLSHQIVPTTVQSVYLSFKFLAWNHPTWAIQWVFGVGVNTKRLEAVWNSKHSHPLSSIESKIIIKKTGINQ